MPHLTLASTSPYRKALLEQLGWPFTVKKPPFDEESAKSKAPTDPRKHATFLAEGKTQSVLSLLKDPLAIVIGGDQLVSFEGQILGKPHSAERAVAQLMAMSGKTHELLTGISVGAGAKRVTWVHTTRLTMRNLSQNQIEEYVRRDEPLDCAGSYKIEKQGLILFEKIECDDWSAIQGIPLLELSRVLIRMGMTPLEK